MTSPNIGQEVIKVPGIGDELQNSIAPFVQAMQFRQHLQAQALADRQRIAAELFARGVQQPGFGTTDAAIQLEHELGVPGLGASIEKARTADEKAKIDNVKDLVDTASTLTDTEKSAAKLSMIAGIRGATSEVQNNLYEAVAGKDLSGIEGIRIAHMQAQTAEIVQRLGEMRQKENGQQQAAQQLNVPPTQFNQGVDYISVLETQMKAREADPAKIVFNGALTIMASQKDLFGNPTSTVESALAASAGLYNGLLPATAKKVTLSPDVRDALTATRDAMQLWNQIRSNGDTYKKHREPSDTGFVGGSVKFSGDTTVIHFKSPQQIQDFIEKGIKALYPTVTDERRKMMFDVIRRQLYSSGEPSR